MTKRMLRIRDVANSDDEQLISYDAKDLIPLDALDELPSLGSPQDRWLGTYDFSLDGFSDFDIPKPETLEEKEKFIQEFMSGLEKLFDPQNNWTFLKAFKLSMDYCLGCQTCSDACHVYLGSGKQEIYRPTYRSEVFRRLYK